MKRFDEEVQERIADNRGNEALRTAARVFMRESTQPKYSYNFSWLGRPIIQYPQDIVAMQELVWTVKPDMVVETGIAHGGSLILWASLLELNAACGGPSEAEVIGIDIDIRSHNREAIEAHPLSRRVKMIEGSSVEPTVIAQVTTAVRRAKRVMVCLDSNHTHSHVLRELEAYAPLTTVGSYCVVFDTVIEELPDDAYPDRPWGPGNSPASAVQEYLRNHSEFEIDHTIDDKLLITVAPGGYLRRVR